MCRAGRTGRAGREGLVTAFIQKRDKILSMGIQAAIQKNYPLDDLSSDKDDYYKPEGRLHFLLTDYKQPNSVATKISMKKEMINKYAKSISIKLQKLRKTKPASAAAVVGKEGNNIKKRVLNSKPNVKSISTTKRTNRHIKK